MESRSTATAIAIVSARPRVERYSSIQAARFIAAFLVVAGHALIFTNQKYGGLDWWENVVGWLGGYSVNLFFAISGFVIPASAQRLSARGFLTARFLRIYPGYFLAVSAVLLGKRALFGSWVSNEVSAKALALLPFGHIGYPLWVEWSLVFEVFFYLLFGLIWCFKSNRVVLGSMMGWLALIVVAFAVKPGSGDRYPLFSEIFFSFRNLPFIFGAFVFYGKDLVRRESWALFLIAAIAFGSVPVLTANENAIIVFHAVSATCVLLLCLVWSIEAGGVSKLGDYSYGLYLAHTSVITILLSLFNPVGVGAGTMAFAVGSMGLVGGVIFGWCEFALYRSLRRSWTPCTRFVLAAAVEIRRRLNVSAPIELGR